MLISISEALETPVSVLLGETVNPTATDDIKSISEKLEIINLQLARRKETTRKILNRLFIMLFAVIIIIFAVIIFSNSAYLKWDYSDPETAVIGVFLHAFEWLFIRCSPLILIGSIIGIILTRKKK